MLAANLRRTPLSMFSIRAAEKIPGKGLDRRNDDGLTMTPPPGNPTLAAIAGGRLQILDLRGEVLEKPGDSSGRHGNIVRSSASLCLKLLARMIITRGGGFNRSAIAQSGPQLPFHESASLIGVMRRILSTGITVLLNRP